MDDLRGVHGTEEGKGGVSALHTLSKKSLCLLPQSPQRDLAISGRCLCQAKSHHELVLGELKLQLVDDDLQLGAEFDAAVVEIPPP